MPIIILRGGPGVGKSTLSEQICLRIQRSARIEQDILRYFVVGGLVASRSGKTPMRDPEGYFHQCRLGDLNSLQLAFNFSQCGFLPVIAGLDGGESSTSFLPMDDKRRKKWYPEERDYNNLHHLKIIQIMLDPPEATISSRMIARGFDDRTIEFILQQRSAYLSKAEGQKIDLYLDTSRDIDECLSSIDDLFNLW